MFMHIPATVWWTDFLLTEYFLFGTVTQHIPLALNFLDLFWILPSLLLLKGRGYVGREPISSVNRALLSEEHYFKNLFQASLSPWKVARNQAVCGSPKLLVVLIKTEMFNMKCSRLLVYLYQ